MQGELLKSPIQLAEFTERAVTSTRRAGTPVAERKRRQRQRERERNLIYERDDWQLFMDLSTLPQKAGCHFQDLYKVVLKELVDNALDAGANVSLQFCDGAWVVSDDGPGIAPGEVPKLFSVNRPLLSSKLKRLPLRGMLGNGLRVVMGAVAATEGGVIVETRGHRLTLAIDTATGKALLVADESIPQAPGLTVRLILGESNSGQPDAGPANQSISIAKCGRSYSGPSSPWWYGGRDLYRLFAHVTPAHTTVASVCRDLGIDCDDERAARHSLPPMLSMFWKLSVQVPNQCRRSVLDLSEPTFIRIGPDTRVKPVSSAHKPERKSPGSLKPGHIAYVPSRKDRAMWRWT